MRTLRIFLMFFFLFTFLIVLQAANRSGASPSFFAAWQLPKVWIAALLAVIGTIILMAKKLSTPVRIGMMVLAFFAFGVVSVLPLGDFARGMGLHPSPMCVIEKPFLFVNAGRSIPIIFFSIFAFVGVLTVASNKSFCGWTCPIGAVQEVFYKIPILKKRKTIIPFRVTNSIRVGLFVAFVLLVFALSFSLYEYLNAFHMLHWTWSWEWLLPIGIALIGGLFVYRPFCYLICPLGLFTWVLEQVSIIRVKLNPQACTDCKICVKKSPCPAVPAILEKKRIRPDCHACGECIKSCPENALSFKVRG